jgi:gamma-glutamylcyclotransferase (GGCT)/AIG2-like uncharacterized protein YtfP
MPGVSLFVYGTLTDPERLHALTGRRFPRRAARLDGYERIAPPDSYPYVEPRTGGCVEGLLIDEVDPVSLRALDRYEDEGRLYVRRPAEAIVDGARVACEVYVGATIREGRAHARTPRRTSDG